MRMRKTIKHQEGCNVHLSLTISSLSFYDYMSSIINNLRIMRICTTLTEDEEICERAS